MNPITVTSTNVSWREKMLESQQVDFLVELGADSGYSFDLDDFCSAEKYADQMREEKEHRE